MKVLHLLVIVLSLFVISTFADQKVVLISGAAGGVGLSAARAFQSEGWKVWAGFHQHVPNELKKLQNVNLCHLDVTDDDLVQSVIATILKEDGRIDVLINNAGYGLIGAEECVTLDESKRLFDVNFFGALRLIQAVVPRMRQQQSGHILNISSELGIRSLPGLGLYSASKFALEGLSESLAATLSHWNIKVSIIEPGPLTNDWGKHCVIGSRTCDEEFYAQLTRRIFRMLSAPKGQSCEAIAEFLVKIIKTSQPHVRYQTSINGKEWVAEKLIDPTGMSELQNNIRFIKSLFLNDFDH